MKIRLGYVALSMVLNDSSTSKTTTLGTLLKLQNKEQRIYTLRKIVEQNLNNLQRILQYNHAEGIGVYRISSKLIPFATHEIASGWNYIGDFEDKLRQIGKYIKKSGMRISMHPDHFTVINTKNPDIFDKSLEDLRYHHAIFEGMGLDKEYKLVMHIGGLYNDKEASIKRFYEGFKSIPNAIAQRIILENDDKSYNVSDVLSICNKLDLPMVLDVHHYNCNNGIALENILNEIFRTWKNGKFPPKIHFSSPKNGKEFRSHADDINVDEFINFLNIAKVFNRDIDIMLEAKNKDLALINLMKGLENTKGIKILSKSQFEINT